MVPRFLLVTLLLLGGCASVTRFNGLPLDAGGTYVSGVTPVHQDANYACGAACVAAVGTHWGVGLADFKARHISAPEDTTGQQLVAMAERLGLRAFAYRGSMDDLRDNLGKGRPLIVMIPLPILGQGASLASLLLTAWNEIGPRPAHWVVVTGMLDDRVILHDPASGPLLVRETRFREWWAKQANLCVLIAKVE